MVEIIIVITCLGLSALFAAYEMAFVSILRSDLRALAKKETLMLKKSSLFVERLRSQKTDL